jgi:hypothetical protein
MMIVTNDFEIFLRARLQELEDRALAASGNTVIGQMGDWRSDPRGDQWMAQETNCGEAELLVALRPDLPRPPATLDGMWGAVLSFDTPHRGEESEMVYLRHIEMHDPARVLRRVGAARKIMLEHTIATAWGVCVRCSDFDEDGSGTIMDRVTGPCNTLRYLAEEFSDHLDYKPEWAGTEET